MPKSELETSPLRSRLGQPRPALAQPRLGFGKVLVIFVFLSTVCHLCSQTYSKLTDSSLVMPSSLFTAFLDLFVVAVEPEDRCLV